MTDASPPAAPLPHACVILAAGRSQRMNADKTRLPLPDGRTMLDAAIALCTGFPTLVVCTERNHASVEGRGVGAVVNRRPDLGMSHSLQLAHAQLPADFAILVLLADKPFVLPATLLAVIDALHAGADVAFPSDGRRSGHPVGFSPRARLRIDTLEPGDTLFTLRDDPELRRIAVPTTDEGAFTDIDEPHEYRALFAAGATDRKA